MQAANILLKGDGTIKVCDFGVSGRMRDDEERCSFIGSPYWMAPEIIENRDAINPYDHMSDVWSLAITAIELADVEPPHSAVHPMRALFLVVLSSEPSDPHTTSPHP